jgi:hypothetical protein
MEEKFITRLKQNLKGSDFGSKQDDVHLWYNEEGDCIQFKTTHVATIGKRVDEYLTLYISVENQKPIGFQLKDVQALLNAQNLDLMAVQVDYASLDKSLVSVSMLIFEAYSKMPTTINRKFGYSEAIRTMVKDKVEIPCKCV